MTAFTLRHRAALGVRLTAVLGVLMLAVVIAKPAFAQVAYRQVAVITGPNVPPSGG
jgi:hypothetical protein